ncbi:MAG: accessory gene regulator B family protein [Bacillota bacterium]
MSYLPFSRRWARHLAVKASLSEEKEVILAYVLEVLVINVSSAALTLLLGFLLGVLPGTAVCLGTVAAFRLFAGGAHASSPWRCAVVTILIFPVLAMLAGVLSPLKQPYVDFVAAAAILTGLALIVLRAPVDSPSAPVISPVRRKRLKYLSILVLFIVAVIVIYLRNSAWAYAPEIRLCLILSVLWVSLILSAAGRRLMALIDSINLTCQQEGRCEDR